MIDPVMHRDQSDHSGLHQTRTRPNRLMPILRQPSRTHQGSNQGFQSAVSTVPMAMSMMIDSMVNMVQNSRPESKTDSNSSTK